MKLTSDISFSQILALAAMVTLGISNTYAYDFSALNTQGKRIYYNQVSGEEAAVTYESKLLPTHEYSGVLELPSTVTYAGTRLKVTSIGDHAFFGCRTLKEVDIPPTITAIGSWAFAWCDSISSITIHEGITSMKADAFDGCFALERIDIAKNNPALESLEKAVYSKDGKTLAMYSPTAEGTLVVREGTEHIADRALGGCSFVDSVKIASTVKSIGKDAFSYCNALTHIYLPASVETIGEKAMSDCYLLEKIDADPANEHFASIDGTLYSHDLSRLIQSPGANPCATPHPQTKEIAPCAFMHNYGLTTINLPATTEIIGNAAFAGCEALVSVVIPEGVKNIGDVAFGLCENLENVYSLSSHPENITLGEGTFASLQGENRTLYVPLGSRSAYAALAQWKDIGTIVETDAFLSQIISWSETSDRSIDDTHIELGASASSGLEVRYAISAMSEGVAAIEGNLLEIIVPGNIYVTAFQPGNSSYLPAEPVTMVYKDPAGLDDTEFSSDIRVTGGRGEIIITGASVDSNATVYSTDGMIIYSGYDRNIKVPGQRIYLVRIGGHTFKVAVR